MGRGTLVHSIILLKGQDTEPLGLRPRVGTDREIRWLICERPAGSEMGRGRGGR